VKRGRSRYAAVVGIPERLELIVKELGISERELARRAGLADSHIGLLRARLRSDPGAVTVSTLEAIAKAANVSVAWLIVGEGDPRERAGVAPSKAAAAGLARAEGVWEEAIRSVLAEPATADNESRPAAWWLLRIKMRELELLDEADRRHAAKRATSSPPALEPTPGKGPTTAKRAAKAKRSAR